MQSRRITQHVSLLGIILRMTDVAGVALGLYAAAAIVGREPSNAGAVAAVAAVAVFHLISEITGLYRSWHGV
jgi:hypothetical protein